MQLSSSLDGVLEVTVRIGKEFLSSEIPHKSSFLLSWALDVPAAVTLNRHRFPSNARQPCFLNAWRRRLNALFGLLVIILFVWIYSSLGVIFNTQCDCVLLLTDGSHLCHRLVVTHSICTNIPSIRLFTYAWGYKAGNKRSWSTASWTSTPSFPTYRISVVKSVCMSFRNETIQFDPSSPLFSLWALVGSVSHP